MWKTEITAGSKNPVAEHTSSRHDMTQASYFKNFIRARLHKPVVISVFTEMRDLLITICTR